MRRFSVLFFLLFTISFFGQGKQYYVSNKGEDKNDGLTPQSAWKTLNKVNSEISRFKPGDVISLHGGEEFYGKLSLDNLKGTSVNPIEFTSYGTGKAVIKGTQIVTGWIKESANTWSAKTVSSNVVQVFKTGIPIGIGKLPKTALDSKPKESTFTITSGSGRTFYCDQLKSSNGFNGELKGATVHISSAFWRLQARTITAFNNSTGQITIDSGTAYSIDKGDTFFVTNGLDLLTETDEWYFNSSLKKLYIHSSSQPVNIEVSSLSDGISITNSSYVNINNLKIRGFNGIGIKSKSNNVTIDNSKIEYCYSEGINESGGGFSVSSTSIKGSNYRAINSYSDNAQIINNNISEIGLFKNITIVDVDNIFGIKLYGSHSIARGNTLDRIGYVGIELMNKNCIVEQNYITNHCLTLHDGAAIYTYNGVSGNSIVRNNIIVGLDFKSDKWFSNGIYLDDRTIDVNLEGNTTTNVYHGIFLHNTRNCKINNNTIYKTQKYSLALKEDDNGGGSGYMTGNTVSNNIIFSTEHDIVPFFIRSTYNTWNFGKYDNNKFWNPYSLNKVELMTNSIVGVDNITGLKFNLEAWKSFQSNDANSFESKELKIDYNSVYKGNNLISNNDFEVDISGWSKNGGTIKRIPNDKGGYCLEYNSGGLYKKVHPTNINLTAGKTYMLEFDAQVDNYTQLKIMIGENGGDWTSFFIQDNIGITNNWNSYQYIFKSTESVSTSVGFWSYGETGAIRFDNISLREVVFTPKVNHRIFYNNNRSSKAIPLPTGVWEDLMGKQYEGSVTIEPYLSKILISSNDSIKKTAVNVNAGEDVNICFGESTTLTASGGSSYLWSTGETSKTITVKPAVTTTYKVTVSEGSDSASDEVLVTLNNVVADAGGEKTIIQGESVTLTASGGDSYLWNTGATSSSINVSPNATTTYTVIATKGPCEDSDSTIVNVNVFGGEVNANAGEDVNICFGESTTLTASGGSSYLWSTGETSKTITVKPSETKSYFVTVSENTISDTDEVLVYVNKVIANAGEDRTISEGATITLVAEGGDEFLWNTGAKTKMIEVSPVVTKTYSVIVSKGNCQDSDELIVKVVPKVDSDPIPPKADAGEDRTICLDESITLTGFGGETYLWSTGETSKQIQVNPTRTTTFILNTFNGEMSGTDSVTITVENCQNNQENEMSIFGDVLLYPNPTNGILNIESSHFQNDYNLIISDAKGSIIYTDSNQSSFSSKAPHRKIYLGDNVKGVYYLRITNSEINYSQKIILL